MFHYAGNNPVRYIDPDGRNTLDDYAYQLKTCGDYSNADKFESMAANASNSSLNLRNMKYYLQNENQYYDSNGNIVFVGIAMPNDWEILGDAFSQSALFLNYAGLGCLFTGNITVSEGCGFAASLFDIGAVVCYTIAGSEKWKGALIGVVVDLVPGVAYHLKPSLKPAFNYGAKRFINPKTGRFIKNTIGLRNYCIGPVSGIIYSFGSEIYSNSKE